MKNLLNPPQAPVSAKVWDFLLLLNSVAQLTYVACSMWILVDMSVTWIFIKERCCILEINCTKFNFALKKQLNRQKKQFCGGNSQLHVQCTTSSIANFLFQKLNVHICFYLSAEIKRADENANSICVLSSTHRARKPIYLSIQGRYKTALNKPERCEAQSVMAAVSGVHTQHLRLIYDPKDWRQWHRTLQLPNRNTNQDIYIAH